MDATYNLSGGFKPTMKRFADLDGPDYFPTPAWATHALIDNENFVGDIANGINPLIFILVFGVMAQLVITSLLGIYFLTERIQTLNEHKE